MTRKARFKLYHTGGHGCWLWLGGKSKTGYGRFFFEYTKEGKSRVLGAHRASYLIHVGPIPRGMSVLHRCDNPACVRPAHLFLGNQLTNILDMVAKGRQARGPAFSKAVTPSRARGERSGRCKLSDRQVRNIRRSSWSAKRIAKHYKIHPNYVSMLRKNRYRKDSLS